MGLLGQGQTEAMDFVECVGREGERPEGGGYRGVVTQDKGDSTSSV